MVSDLFFHEFLLLGLLWLCLILYWLRLRCRAAMSHATPKPATRAPRGSKDPQPFPGLTHKPRCVACEHAQEQVDQAPPALPPLLAPKSERPHEVDTYPQFCPSKRASIMAG
jgi:hypothetical protein